jgi:putative nucleotidyltransferase with HDIG domain
MPSGRDAPTQIAPRTERWLPHAIIATACVVVLPALVVWMVVPRGEPALLALSVPLGMLLSVLAAAVGGALWKRVPGSRDLVFADLMLWGWLRRLRAERRLEQAETLLGTHAEGLSVQALTDLSAMLEARDTFTYGHSLRVTRHAERIATELGLSEDDVAQVRTAAALHDVGKLHTPREILNNPQRLTDEEFAVIRRHPGDGADLSTSVGVPAITAMIRHHHERLDGSGYPAGLAGNAIPLGARIIAVADTFDAMTSNRA